MATSAPTAAQLELINSLSQDDIPIKLRCAICSKLAVNAFRLPCCEQAICESCQSTLPSSCPVCEHTPVAAVDCKPNKSLRTTIKVFLRTEEKKREAFRLKEVKDTPPATPSTISQTGAISAAPPEVAPTPAPEVKAGSVDPSVSTELSTAIEHPEDEQHAGGKNDSEALLSDQQDVPQPSIEEIAPGQEQTEDGTANNEHGQLGETRPTENGQIAQLNGANDLSQNSGFGMGFGFDVNTSGFPNMGMMGQGGDFNQMQMMMAMQNGMASNAFGNFPMMGMPGMNMDPMAMQSMYMNGGFGAQGMGMNGMNMGMGMAGFDGGMGTGFNNGWNGQQSWNVGQDNFNHPNASSMGHGDFGTNNTGYQAGFNQGNYGRTNQYNDFQQNGYSQGQYTRGRGRGRGYGFGQSRGGHGYGQNDVFPHQDPQQLQNGSVQNDSGLIPSGPKAAVITSAPHDGNVDQYGREIREKTEATPLGEGLVAEPAAVTEGGTTAQTGDDTISENTVLQKEVQTNAGNDHDEAPRPIQTLEQIQRPGHFNGYNGYGSMHPPNGPIVPKADIPFNAPTGPKAMREGLPNTSIMHLRARGLSAPGQNGHNRQDSNAEISTPLTKSRSGTPEKEKERDRSQSRSRSRSPTDEHRHKKHHRHRSTSLSEDGKEEERRRERRRRHLRKHEDEAEDRESGPADEDIKERSNGGEQDRSRSQSATESRRSSHRSRRDRDYDREKDRDRERDKEHKSSSHKHRSSHRSHRERSRERDRGDRDRDRDRSHEHRHRRRHESIEPLKSKEKDRDPETAPSSAVSEKAPVPIVIPSGPRSMTLTMSNAFSAEPVASGGKANGIEINIRGTSRRKTDHISEAEPASATSSRADERKDRDREREREKDRDREKDREKNRERERDRERSNRHRDDRDRYSSSRSERKSDSHVKIPTGPAAATATKQPNAAKPPKPAADPHTVEREARNRERLLKEAQRMAGLSALMSGTAGRKRSLAAATDDGGVGEEGDRRRSRKSRVKSDRWEEDDEEQGEARLERLEREREGGR